METTATTGNNLGHPGATAPGFMIGGQLPAVKEEVVFYKLSSLFPLNIYTLEHSRVNRGRRATVKP
ncbi:MAG: hypothetical protein IJI36_03375 [Kiritimatiellae bacterium]|nr:hypothetical protein [Kiritimatiellia bacterium]